MEISQRKLTTWTQFEFEDEKLKYTMKDSAGKRTFSVPYTSISTEKSELEERSNWFRNVGIFWVLIGVVQIVYRLIEGGSFGGSLWLTLGVICFIIYGFSGTKFTILESEKGGIFVLNNKEHDNIIDTIFSRRKEQLKLMLGDIDFSNDPRKEVRKFQFLHNEKVITDEEYDQIINKLQASSMKLNPN
ncbi:MAG: hypothetical protein P9L92_18380 [Candidatus Electryonea clarkiae]|nr:hypothetical protein [Candidatus Electryonea clarkiae]MDP8287138.1 hypothetical protein [Candidatus Electryonea clarkiae]